MEPAGLPVLSKRASYLALDLPHEFLDSKIDPYEFVLSANIHRRHLSSEQKRELIAEVLKAAPEKSNRQIAEAVKVDHKTVASVRAEKRSTGEIPQLTMTVGKDGRQRQQPAKKPPAASLTERRVRMEAKAERRAEREIQLAQRAEAMPSRRFAVIYADAAWRFEPYSRETGMDRAADNHYPTMTTAEIAAMDIASIAAPDCVLFMWATVPMLPDALEVMKAWSFTYKSHIVWDKGRIGTGYWTRNRHELLLIGTRGDIPAPAMGQQPESMIAAPVGAHSAKPDCFAELIERGAEDRAVLPRRGAAELVGVGQ